MSRWQPCKRREFIRRLKKLNFTGPYYGAKHQFMVYQRNRLAIPSNKEYSVPQLKMMLSEVESIINQEISLEKWNKLAK